MSKRPKIGDVIEIPLPMPIDGYGYAQCTHKHEQYGHLLRVFDVREKVENINELTTADVLFTTFFPLGVAVHRGIVLIAGNLPLRQEFEVFPIFRSGMLNKEGVVEVWWLWDGEKEWRVGKLSKEQEAYPIRQIVNDTYLIEELLNNDQRS